MTVTGGTAAFQVAPTLNGVGAKASGNINGTASETYVSANLSNYKWFQSEALPTVSVTNYDLYVGGTQVTSANAADILGDGTVSYDHNTKTLTLNNATITNWHEYGNNDRSGIYCEGNLFINLVGNNKVIQQTVATNNMEIGCSSYAVYIKDQMGGGGNLTFTGTGSLTAASANTNDGYANSWSVAIYTFGIVKVRDNCTVTAYCGKSTRAEAAIYTDTLNLPEGMVAVGNKTAYDDSTLEAVRGRNNDYKYVEIAPGYTVTLNTVFGTINSGNVSYYFVGEGTTLPTDVTKTGKTFAGWYDNAACTGDAVTSIAANAIGAKEYWAKWTEDDSAISVTGVNLNKATLALTEGDSSMLTADVAPDNATNKTVTWTSSNPAVATVDANGKVTAVAVGTATIIATTEDGGKTATCAVTVSHDYTAQTKKAEALKTAGNCRDYAVYYYSCSDCGKVENNHSHTFNGDKVPDTHVGGSHVEGASEPDHKTQTAGSTGAAICDGCNATLTPAQAIQPDAHTPANVWSSDETYHWKECTVVGCGIVIHGSKAEHSSTGANVATCQKAAVCDICSRTYGIVVDHDFEKTWSKDASGHWYACQTADCTEKNGFATHTPDHQGGATEEYAIKCTMCQFEIEAQLGHTHVYGNDWKSHKDNHWNECACGDKTNSAAHKDENKDGKCDVCAYNVGVPATPTDPPEPSDDVRSPQTGDNSMMWLWIALLFVSGFGVVATTVLGKKKTVR